MHVVVVAHIEHAIVVPHARKVVYERIRLVAARKQRGGHRGHKRFYIGKQIVAAVVERYDYELVANVVLPLARAD